ncbi:MAG: protease modulator HflC [Candidatus Omnitrophota bacterium]
MKILIRITAALVFAVIVFFAAGVLYIISETDQVVITQFGRPVRGLLDKPGLHFKLPFIQKAHYFEKRLLEWDGDPNQIPTRDKKYIWVDTTARWRIVDALTFLESVGSERGAQARLDDVINSATRDVITSHLLVEAIRDSNRILETTPEDDSVVTLGEEALEKIKVGRHELEQDILSRSKVIVPQYGIELVDVRIKRINYVEDVRKKVYDRMISERKRAAEMYRSEGRGKSAEVEGGMEKELKLITSQAYKTSQGLRGAADAKAIAIYAEAYGKDPEFYSFTKTLETYGDTIDSGTTIVLTTSGDYYKYIKSLE